MSYANHAASVEDPGPGNPTKSDPISMLHQTHSQVYRTRPDRSGSIRRWTPAMGMLVAGVFFFLLNVGCRTYHNLPETIGNDTHAIDAIMIEVDHGLAATEYPDTGLSPLTIRDAAALDEITYRDLSLEEAIQIALSHATVLRDLGATVLRSPQSVVTDETRGLAQTDPQAGIEAALSAYDAQFYALGKWQNNDRRFNNVFFGGGSTAFQQDTHDYVFQMSKRTATGAQFAVRSVTDYDANNATGNLTDSAWQSQLHAEARQPLLQGGGLTFNRIAGPGAQPGIYNGVLIAKVNTDISSAKFQQGMRDYVSNVINAYWDLYFAYRDLDTKRESLQRSRATWQAYEAQKSSNRRSGASEAMAREQYFRFESELQDAIAGRQTQRTQNNNAASGGSFAGVGGVLAAERRLRLLIGLPLNDGALVRPADDPLVAPLVFDWDSISIEAIQMRSELQQQRLLIKRREMELLAAKNFLMPSLDLVSVYRVRGLDKRLAGDDSAFRELGSWDFQEYEASLELKLPVGFRQAHAAVRHAQIQLARDKALMHEQERQILHDLASVVSECDRAFAQMQSNMNRFIAASDALAALEASRRAGLPINLEQLLDAQRRVSESQSLYYQSLTEYTLATKNVQFEKGTLLSAIDIYIAGDAPGFIATQPTLTTAEPAQAESATTLTNAENPSFEALLSSADPLGLKP